MKSRIRNPISFVIINITNLRLSESVTQKKMILLVQNDYVEHLNIVDAVKSSNFMATSLSILHILKTI